MSVMELGRARERRQSFAPGVIRDLLIKKVNDEIRIEIAAMDAFEASAVSGMSVRLHLQTSRGMQVLTGRIEHTPAAHACAPWFHFILRPEPSPKALTYRVLPGLNAMPVMFVQFRLGTDWIDVEHGYAEHFRDNIAAR